MVFTTPCSSCEHKKVCAIRPKYSKCLDIIVDTVGASDVFNSNEIVFICPYCTDTSTQEAVLAYKRALQ